MIKYILTKFYNYRTGEYLELTQENLEFLSQIKNKAGYYPGYTPIIIQVIEQDGTLFHGRWVDRRNKGRKVQVNGQSDLEFVPIKLAGGYLKQVNGKYVDFSDYVDAGEYVDRLRIKFAHTISTYPTKGYRPINNSFTRWKSF